MSVIISFFLGLIIFVSGDEISLLANISFLSLICNVVGGCLMAYGIKLYLDKLEMKSRYKAEVVEELKNISQKMITTLEYESIQEYMKTICKNQENYEIVLGESKNIILSGILDLKADVDKRIDDVINLLTSQANEVKNVNKALVLLNSTRADEIDGLKNKIEELKEILHIDNTSCIDSIVKLETTMRQVSENEVEQIVKALETINVLQQLPREIMGLIDELTVKIDGYLSDLSTRIEYLSQDIEDQDKKRMTNFNKMLDEIRDYSEENNDEMSEQIKVLGQQYLQFEKTVDAIVRQMTQMAENDCEIMKGFLNG